MGARPFSRSGKYQDGDNVSASWDDDLYRALGKNGYRALIVAFVGVGLISTFDSSATPRGSLDAMRKKSERMKKSEQAGGGG